MANPAFIRITEKVTLLKKQAMLIENRIIDLTKIDQQLKSTMHNIEFKLAFDDSDATPFRELNELRHDHQTIKNDEHTLANLKQELKELQKQIDNDTFWMKRADTNDEVRQQEAEKHVFG